MYTIHYPNTSDKKKYQHKNYKVPFTIIQEFYKVGSDVTFHMPWSFGGGDGWLHDSTRE